MKAKTPTASEIAVLQILWERKTATAPELHAEICKEKVVGYTTVLKRVQRMEEKGLIKRTHKIGRAHQYKALWKPQATRKGLVSGLIKNAFDDSPNALIQHAIKEHDLSETDIAELRALLDQIESKT